MTTAPQSEIKTLDITRQQKIKEALYTYLLNKREETALQLAINEANIRIVEYPYGSGNPVSPHTGRILLIAFTIGLLIPAGIFWFLITMDKTVHGRKDIEDELSAPILGGIPPYRMPTAKSVCIHTWEKGRQYLQKMGGIILVFSLVIWALNYFPHPR